MDRTTVFLGRLGSAALAGGLALLIVLLGGNMAQALQPTCPPRSSLCSPAGLLVMADPVFAASGATAAATSTGAGSVAVTSGFVGRALDLALAVSGSVAVAGAFIDTSNPVLQPVPATPVGVSGWVSGVNTVHASSYYSGSFSYVLNVSTSVPLGGSGPVTVSLTKISGCPNPYDAPYVAQGSVALRSSQFNWSSSTGCAVMQSTVTTNVTNLQSITGAGGVIWYPVGKPGRFEPPAVDTGGQIRSRLECVDAVGAAEFVEALWDIAASDSPSRFDVPALRCPAGKVAASSSLDWLPSGGGASVNIGTVSQAPQVLDIPVEFPGCVDGSCVMELWQTFAGAPALFCGAAAVGCPQWWTDPAKSTNYQCRYGGVAVDIGQCGVYRKPGEVNPNVGVVVDPVTGVITVTDPVVKPDPVPGEFPDWRPEPDPKPDPNPDPNPDPVPPLPWPDFDGDQFADVGRCFPQGWGIFNPLEWVYIPVTCSLSWAFVPPPGVIEGLSVDFRDGVSSKPPFSIIEPGVGAVQNFAGSRGSTACSFGDFFPSLDDYDSASCVRPSGLDALYVVETVLIWTGALWSAVRMVAAAVGNKEVAG